MRTKRNPALPGLLILVVIVLVYFVTIRRPSNSEGTHQGEPTTSLNRDKSRLVFSKHARCRMACRNIDSTEVMEILQAGSVNYQKSDTIGSRDPKFALEGRTHDRQRVRIIFAMAESKTVVVTVIDLDQDNKCHCP
jgi:hypothetical protein